jgi:hypothetical protein
MSGDDLTIPGGHMNRVSILVISVCCIAFAGCVVKGPEVRVKPPVEINAGGDNGGGGKFCPPGQAKKGRC